MAIRLPAGFALLLSLLLPVSLQTVRAAPPEPGGTVVRVYDGDTIEVADVGKVRLLGIDAPEFEASGRDRFYLRRDISPETLRRTARRARSFTIDQARGKHVSLTLDHQHRDRYDRLLAYVHLPDGRLLNRLLVKKGLAAVYRRFDFRMKEDFLDAEAEARRAGRGMWKQ